MAARFWVLGTGTWDASTTTHWAASSGGAGGQSVPGSADSVTFDANSGGGTVTTSSAPTIGSLTMTNATAMTLNGNLTVAGSVAFGSAVAYGGTVTLTGTGAQTITSNAQANIALTINTTGTYTLQDNIIFNDLILTAGTFNANNKNVTFGVIGLAGTFSSTGTGTRTLTMGSGAWTFAAGPATGAFWTISGSNITLNANTSTITFQAGGVGDLIFAGGGQTYNNFNFNNGNNTHNLAVTGSNTFADFKDQTTSAHTITFDASGTTTVTTFSVDGSDSSHRINLRSSSPGTQYTLSAASGTIHRFYLDIQDSAAAGGASWVASFSKDSTGNTGWVFQSIPSMLLVF